MGDLLELNKKYKCDKAHILHLYEPVFEPVRDRVKSVCEIGVQYGGSIRLWEEYFPNIEKVVGVDLNTTPVRSSKIVAIMGDIMAPGVVDQVKENGPYDIMIDDASHFTEQFIPTFHSLLDSAKLFYIIEDLGMDWKNVEALEFLADQIDQLQHVHRNIRLRVEDIADAKIQCISVYHALVIFEKIWRYNEVLRRKP
jgi:hypothetical protein